MLKEKENKKNVLKEKEKEKKENIKGNNVVFLLPLKSKQRSEEHPNP